MGTIITYFGLENGYSLFTDLLFSQMIVERANENKNCQRLVTAIVGGGGGGGGGYFFSPCAFALALRASSATDLRRKNKTSMDRLKPVMTHRKYFKAGLCLKMCIFEITVTAKLLLKTI